MARFVILISSILIIYPYKINVFAGFILFLTFVSFGGPAVRLIILESTAKEKGRALSSIYTLPSLVAIPMPFIGALLFEINSLLLFAFASVFYLISLLIVLLLRVKETLDIKVCRKEILKILKEKQLFFARISPFAFVSIAILLAVYSLDKLSGAIIQPFFPLYMIQKFGTKTSIIGLIFSIYMGVVGIVAPIAGRLIDRWGSLQVGLLSFFIEGFLTLFFILASMMWLAIGIFWIRKAVDFLDEMVPTVFISKLVTKGHRGKALSLFSIITSVFRFPGALIGAILFLKNINYIYFPEIIFSFVAVISFLYLLRKQRKNTGGQKISLKTDLKDANNSP